MVGDSLPVLVQAIYSFKGKNNDELCFKKGDIVTITQREEGGWWEGTLGEKTGWFPSNYVKEHKLQDSTNLAGATASGSTSPSAKLPVDLASQQKGYRNVVLKDIIDSEKANVSELQGLLKNFLHPLEKSEILSREEYRQLVGNIGHVVETHQQLLSALEDCNQRSAPDQRVGKVFLTSAPRIKQVHQAYCSSHPRAVCILDKYKDELNGFMESQGAASPGLLVLTTGLSKPFRRLEKYAGMLQELERHLEENHPDRGDTQRSVSVYKDLASSCSGTRRQKELELEVLTGGVRGWEGEDLACLGEILHMGSVAVGPDHRDRYLVLFSSTLLMLSVSQRMSAFIYEGKLPLTGINVVKLDDTDAYKNAFEITGPMIERILAVCQTREDQQTWVDMLKQHIRVVRSSSAPSPTAVSPPPGKATPVPPPHVSLSPASPYATLAAYFASLIHDGLLTGAVLKRLLYAQINQYEGMVDFVGVRVRHSHKVECLIFPTKVSGKFTWIKSSSDDGSSGPRSAVLERQNAVDLESSDCSSCSSCASSPFGFVRYYPEQGVGEVFHSLNDENRFEEMADGNVEPSAEYISKFTLNISTTNAFSKNRPYLNIISNQPSDESSFERSSAHNEFSYTASACENLSHLDNSPLTSFSTTHLNAPPSPASHESRQSLPTSFRTKPPIPPKPLTLCAPLYQSVSQKDLMSSCHGVKLKPQPQLSHSLPVLPLDQDSSPPASHSSTLDVPSNLIQVPNAMLAELLYNQGASLLGLLHLQESVSSGRSTDTVKTVRAVSKDDLSTTHGKQLQWSRYAWKASNKTKAPNNIYHGSKHGPSRLKNINDGADNTAKSTHTDYCHCCGQAQLPGSSRSSDSGLADIACNSTLPSPDLMHPLLEASSSDVSEYSMYNPPSMTPQPTSENAAAYEAQCVCSSPFSSTPRTSAQPSLTSENIFVGSSESIRSTTSLCMDMSSVPTSQPWDLINQAAETSRPRTYRSGMYAHWWLKAKIPASAIMAEATTGSGPSLPSQAGVSSTRSPFSESQSSTSERHEAS